MKNSITTMKEVYDKHKNLKLAAEELGMVWQTLYYNLNKVGHPVTGDKERYGSPTDKMTKAMEDKFKLLVPHAEDYNKDKFQALIDFKVGAYLWTLKAPQRRMDIRAILERNQVIVGHFLQKYRKNVQTL
ncbi:hypothetical protein NVP1193O_185 [Vibrio phage 1.193.O._10N.286.52.C6]|nr:hypothetical protein NVP1193O_185 [Vibrio phage 1.193.O._10N.286.52.C6]